MMNTLLEFLRTCWPALLATGAGSLFAGERQLRDYCDPAAGQNRHPGAWERKCRSDECAALTGKAARAVDNYRGFGQKHHFRPSGRLFHEGPIPPECLQQ